jgi:HD-GYP domain-containing protein (c-di-GMP phosphodiesterase class II)
MYVAELDRSWQQSPFSGPGLLITDPRQIQKLRQACRYVYVDPDRSLSANGAASGESAMAGHAAPLGTARQLIDGTVRAMAELVRGARRDGVVDVVSITHCAEALAEHLDQAAESLHWVLRTEDHGGFLYRRAVGTAVVAATLGRQLGMDHEALRSLALGGLLLDLGKIAVPVPILAKPFALNNTEQTYVRRHVERGVELLGRRELEARALEMVAGHHERLDGSGYPHQLGGTRIPLFARMAAIADAYDAMTLNRRYAAAMAPPAALRQLDTQRGEKFDAALVTELAHALGPHPVGTLVELVDGSVGLVHAQRPGYPQQPHVVMTHDAARQPLAEPKVVTACGAMDIVRSLPPHTVRIDTSHLDSALRRLEPAC